MAPTCQELHQVVADRPAGYFSTYRSLEPIKIGVARQLIDRSATGVCLESADGRLQLAEALAANSSDAAYQLRLDHEIGSIASGKKTGLTGLDRNLCEIPTSEFAKTAARMTMPNGRFTHRKA